MKVNVTPADLQPLVEMADVNKDGKIDVDEFIMILNGSNPNAVYDQHTMSIVINIRKSRRISPIDFIKIAGDMPSHFTPSFILEQHKLGKILPSSGLIPTL